MPQTFSVSHDITASARLPRQRKNHAGLGQLSLLSLALAAGFAPLSAQADCSAGGTVSTALTSNQQWGAGNCTITSSGSVTVNNSTAALYKVAPSVKTLFQAI